MHCDLEHTTSTRYLRLIRLLCGVSSHVHRRNTAGAFRLSRRQLSSCRCPSSRLNLTWDVWGAVAFGDADTDADTEAERVVAACAAEVACAVELPGRRFAGTGSRHVIFDISYAQPRRRSFCVVGRLSVALGSTFLPYIPRKPEMVVAQTDPH